MTVRLFRSCFVVVVTCVAFSACGGPPATLTDFLPDSLDVVFEVQGDGVLMSAYVGSSQSTCESAGVDLLGATVTVDGVEVEATQAQASVRNDHVEYVAAGSEGCAPLTYTSQYTVSAEQIAADAITIGVSDGVTPLSATFSQPFAPPQLVGPTAPVTAGTDAAFQILPAHRIHAADLSAGPGVVDSVPTTVTADRLTLLVPIPTSYISPDWNADLEFVAQFLDGSDCFDNTRCAGARRVTLEEPSSVSFEVVP